MRRYPIAIVTVLAVLAVAAVAAAPAVISSRLAKADVIERIGGRTGGLVRLRGEPVVTIFPSVGIEVKDVIVSGAGVGGAEDPPLITIPSLKASLRILPLLAGRVEVGTLTLVNPRFHLVVDKAGTGNWRADRIRSATVLGAATSGLADGGPGRIIVRDGAIAYEDYRTGRTVEIAANLHLAWQSATHIAELSGTLAWRDELTEISAAPDASSPASGEKGRRGHPTASAAPTSLSADDAFDVAAPQGLAGEAGFSNSSLGHLAEWLGMPIAQGGPTLVPLRIAGKLEADETSVTLSEATLELDGNAAEGTLALRLGGGRPRLQGLLAFDELDLNPYVEAFLPSNATLSELLARLSYVDVDVRATADEVDLGNNQFTETAAALLVRNGRMTLTLEEADLAGGHMEGAATVEPAKEGVAARLSVRLNNVSVADAGRFVLAARASQLMGADIPLLGTGTATLDLSATGATIGALLESLNGQVAIDLEDGSVDGIDVPSTLDGIADGSTVIADGNYPFMPVAGRTSFATLTARVTIESGIAHVEQVRFRGDRYEVALSGAGDLRHGEIDAEGIASLFTSESGDGDGRLRPIVELPFGVGGTMKEPMIAPGIPRIESRSDEAIDLPSRAWRSFADRDSRSIE